MGREMAFVKNETGPGSSHTRTRGKGDLTSGILSDEVTNEQEAQDLPRAFLGFIIINLPSDKDQIVWRFLSDGI